jgi:hypothetical protein
VQEHARAGVAHDAADVLPLFRRIAVHGALVAGGLIRTERTAHHPLGGVIRQGLAVRAQIRALRGVVRPAVQDDHLADGVCFALETVRGDKIFDLFNKDLP